MNSPNLRSLTIGLVLTGVSQLTLHAEPFAFAHDDLLLGIQAAASTGVSQNVFVNLGKTTDFLNNGNRGTITNIGAVLEDVYGEDWFSRGDLWFGVAGNRNHLSSDSPPPEAGQDPTRTWYVSRFASAPGASVTWAPIGGPSLGSGGTAFYGFKKIFTNPAATEVLQGFEVSESVTLGNVTVLDQQEHPIAWNNSWSKWNPTPGAAFNIWNGGLQNNFGKEGNKVSVDVQRVVANTPGEFVVTISIGEDGTITAEGPAVTPGIPAFVDTDGDGLSDFLEDLLVDYGFDKNVSQTALVQQFLTSQGFYTEDSIQDLRTANQMIIEAQGPNVNLSLPVFKSGTLEDWTPAGELTLDLAKDGDKQFYRIEISGAE